MKLDMTGLDAAVVLTVKQGDITLQVSEGMDEDYVIEVLQATLLMLQQAQAQAQQVYRKPYRH